MKRFGIAVVALVGIATLTLAQSVARQGQKYAGGVSVHFATSNGVTEWWVEITENENTQTSPSADPCTTGTDDEGFSGLKSAPPIVAPNGETYKVSKGKLRKKVVNPAGRVSWVIVKPPPPEPKPEG